MANIANDSFTATGGTGSPLAIDLTSHTSDSGHAWSGSADIKILTDSDHVNCRAGTGAYNYATISATPLSADYDTSIDVTIDNLDNFKAAGVLSRITSAGGNSGYFAEVDNNEEQVQLARLDAGVKTLLGTPYALVVSTLPVTYKITVRVEGSTIKLFVDDVERSSVTDATYPLAGFAGVSLRSASVEYGAPSIDNFTADTLPSAGPTITGPDTTTEGAVTVQTGTLQDTVVTQSLVSGSYSIEQTIDSATATKLNYVAESGVNQCTPPTPVSGVPLAATITAAGITPYVVQQKADDGVNPPATRNITLNPEATHEVIQTMIAVANTTPDQSIFGTNIIVVEDDMQAYLPKTANGMTITWAADGTFGTGTTDQTEVIDVFFFAPSTGNWSCISLTIQDTSIIAVGMATDMVASMVSNMVEDM